MTGTAWCAKVDSWLPRDHVETVRGLARQIDEAMAGFIRGQGTVCLVARHLFYAVGAVARRAEFRPADRASAPGF